MRYKIERIEYGQITYGENPSMKWEVYLNGLPVGPEFETEKAAQETVEWLKWIISDGYEITKRFYTTGKLAI